MKKYIDGINNLNAVELAFREEIHHIKYKCDNGGNEKSNLIPLPHYKHMKEHHGYGLFRSLMPSFPKLSFVRMESENIVKYLIQRDIERALPPIEDLATESLILKGLLPYITIRRRSMCYCLARDFCNEIRGII